ncbi:MAG: hypothetical protein V1745_03510 [Patescibacteria group bacterium]
MRRVGLKATHRLFDVVDRRTRDDVFGNLAFYAGFFGFLVFGTIRMDDSREFPPS